MPVDYQGPGGQVVNAKLINGFLRNLGNLVVQGGKASLREGSRKLAWEVKQGIKSNKFGVPGIKHSTELARKAGKKAGVFPARPKMSGTTPLYASGATVRQIMHKIESDSLARVWVYAPSTGTRAPSPRWAKAHETGFTIRGRYTARMLKFLHVMLKTGGGVRKHAKLRKEIGKARAFEKEIRYEKGREAGAVRVGTAYSRQVVPRPAWTRAEEQFQPKWNEIVVRNITEVIQRGLMGRYGTTGAPPNQFAGGEFGM